MYELILRENNFIYMDEIKRPIFGIKMENLKDYTNPLIYSMTRKIDDLYGMRTVCVLAQLYYGEDSDDFQSYDFSRVENFNGKIDYVGLCIITIGCSRPMLTRGTDGKIKDKFITDDGDMTYFSKEYVVQNSFSFPPVKNLAKEMISILIFVR